MTDRKITVPTLEENEFHEAPDSSSGALDSLKNGGAVESQGRPWEIGAARDYLRDAAWADQLWH